jgi:predicted ATPase/Tfp pilus assembly protein PilF
VVREAPKVVAARRPFVGRTSELDAIDAAFSDGAPLVTLTGGPGTGKTRLALERAALESNELGKHGGVWFCDLSLAESADDLVGIVAGRLGIPLLSRRGDQAVQQVGYALAGRGPALVVLDNFEQLVPTSSGRVVERWIESAPEAMFLVTSQRRLGIEHEHVLVTGPLPEAAAVELFVSRARAARPDFALTEESVALITRIVRALDCLPLGIELCAARMGVVDERQLLELLDKKLDFTSLDPDHPERHSSLRHAIDWSWQLLDDWHRSALARCSTFRGGFSVDAVQNVVCADEPGSQSAACTLHSLLEASLIQPDGSERYFLLESIREFAAEALARSEERESVERRHEDYFLSAAKSWADTRNVPMLAREAPNLLAVYERALAAGRLESALEAALALEPLFASQGPFARYLTLVDRVFTAGEPEPGLRARAHAARGLVAVLQGSLDEAARDYARARELAAESGSTDLHVLTAVKLGLCAGLSGHREESERWFALARTGIDDAPLDVRRVYFNDLGLVLTQQGKSREAEATLQKALELHRLAANRREEGVTFANLGGRAFERGSVDEARAHYKEALEILEEVNDRRSQGIVLAHIGQMLQELGDLAEARDTLERATNIEREVGDLAWEGIALGMLGNLELEHGQARTAAQRYRESATALAASSYHRNLGLNLAALAVAEAACARFELADEAKERARRLLADAGSPTDLLAAELFEALHAWLRVLKREPNAQPVAEARLQEVRRRALATTSPPDEVRFALRVVARWLASPLRSETPAPADHALVVGPEARWFVTTGGARVEIGRRAAMRRILLHLAERRSRDAGKGAAPGELFETAWPGVKANEKSVAARVYVAIGTLRRLGLSDVLIRNEAGYLLDPSVPVRGAE